MAVFKSPSTIARKFDSVTANFFWGFRQDRPAMHFTSFPKLCRPKRQGGLGFRHFALTNRALLAKQLWNIYKNPNTLCSRWLVGKYFHGSLHNNDVPTTQQSKVWKGIIAIRALIHDSLRWNVGSGTSIPIGSKFWWQPLPSKPPDLHFVSDLRVSHAGTWDQDKVLQCFGQALVDDVMRTPLSFTSVPDQLVWMGSPSGAYSVAAGYSRLLSDQVTLTSNDTSCIRWDVFWKIRVPRRVLLFV